MKNIYKIEDGTYIRFSDCERIFKGRVHLADSRSYELTDVEDFVTKWDMWILRNS